MSDRARIRINLAQRELEIEGSEDFVRSFGDRLEALLGDFEEMPVDTPMPMAPSSAPAVVAPSQPSREVQTADLGGIGEFLTHLPSTASDVDKVLAAGLWVQQQAGDDAFGTGDANRRLLEQGIKVGNASQCVKQTVLAKRVFVVQRGRFRVSQIGRAHLRQLMGSIVPV